MELEGVWMEGEAFSLGWKRCLKADGRDPTEEGRRGMGSPEQSEGWVWGRKRLLTPAAQREEGKDVQRHLCSFIWEGKAWKDVFLIVLILPVKKKKLPSRVEGAEIG